MTFFETDGDAGLHGDFGLLSPVSASPLVAALTGDRAVLAAILKVEAAWAAVLDEAGLAPAGSAAVVAAAADVQRYDVAGIAVRAQGGGNPVIPLLADLREQVRALDADGLGAAQAVHTSLTSQDVLDSALMLLAAGAVRELLAELKARDVRPRRPGRRPCADALRGPEPDPALAALQLRAAGRAVVRRAGRRRPPARSPRTAGADRRRRRDPCRRHRTDFQHGRRRWAGRRAALPV